MKKYLALLIAAIFVYGSVFTQPEADDVDKSLNSGNIAHVAKYFDNMVDITINDEQSTYSKSQAEMVIKNFFSKNSVQSFFVKFRSKLSKDNSVFFIGELHTRQEIYKVYIFFKQKDSGLYLQIIRFEPYKQ